MSETIAGIVRAGAARLAGSPSARLDARLIVQFVLQLTDTEMVVRGDDVVDAVARVEIDAALARRAAGEPVAYITGRKEFWSLSLAMAPAVLIPRPDTETLIAAALARRKAEAVRSILDLGCGSGALLAALLSEYPAARGLGVDRNPAAVALTRKNLAALGLGRGEARLGDWDNPGDVEAWGGPFDLVVSNPPYIPEGDRDRLPRSVRAYEDAGALFSGPDGRAAYGAILALAGRLVAPGGLLILEIGDGQGAALEALAAAAAGPGDSLSVDPDLAGAPRALILARAGPGTNGRK